MNLLKVSITLFIMASVFLPVHASQGVGPEDFLEKDNGDHNVLPYTKPKEETPAPKFKDPFKLMRTITCDDSQTMANYVLEYGQVAWVVGFNRLATPEDPFIGLVITRNPENFSYSVFLNSANGKSCVVATGTEMKRIEDILPQD